MNILNIINGEEAVSIDYQTTTYKIAIIGYIRVLRARSIVVAEVPNNRVICGCKGRTLLRSCIKNITPME